MTMEDESEIAVDDPAMAYWHWHGVATMLRCPHRSDMTDTDIGLIGFPHAGGNAIERMQYLAPRAVRNRSMAYRRILRSRDRSPFEGIRISDLGDVPFRSALNPDAVAAEAARYYRAIDRLGILPITVGGDHSVTTPILRGIAGASSRHRGPIGMIHFDSHCDSFPALAGTANHAGAAFRLGVEEGLIDPKRTVQIGFHGPVAVLDQDGWSRQNFRVITLKEVLELGVERVAADVLRIVGGGPTYVSVDLDVLDLAYAPAVADPEVGGMTPRELFGLLERFKGVNVCGGDIVCYCPPLDGPAQTTALMACEILLHLVTLAGESIQRRS